ncbi:hypothetical protein WN55_05793 [Dufourea novaeangliae]|uniref:Uncharacterized protein n=1 Tax=Dufourea novaeangliae TaxID=178035 RepID=A0A154P029_DUFNO|nr:hypothetical protein WN55_05793 [Dufourea novaeangliae]
MLGINRDMEHDTQFTTNNTYVPGIAVKSSVASQILSVIALELDNLTRRFNLVYTCSSTHMHNIKLFNLVLLGAAIFIHINTVRSTEETNASCPGISDAKVSVDLTNHPRNGRVPVDQLNRGEVTPLKIGLSSVSPVFLSEFTSRLTYGWTKRTRQKLCARIKSTVLFVAACAGNASWLTEVRKAYATGRTVYANRTADEAEIAWMMQSGPGLMAGYQLHSAGLTLISSRSRTRCSRRDDD